jgi:ubiquinone/menaquinone biosynthesis C-methylase UbiE
MADGTSKSELRRTWESAAPGWAKWEQVFSAGLFEATEALLDMAGIGPGMRVLDLACGAGDQTMRAAERVGPNGSVVASDISATMLEHVRRRAASAALPNIDTVESAAEDLEGRRWTPSTGRSAGSVSCCSPRRRRRWRPSGAF